MTAAKNNAECHAGMKKGGRDIYGKLQSQGLCRDVDKAGGSRSGKHLKKHYCENSADANNTGWEAKVSLYLTSEVRTRGGFWHFEMELISFNPRSRTA